MKGRCRTCKYWSQQVEWCAYKGFAYCHAPLMVNQNVFDYDNLPLSGVIIEDEFDSGEELITGPDFGCIHHSPLPKGETK